MGVIIPQVVTSGRATGAQVIDGSLKFNDSANQHLERTISASNRRTFTLSAWVKHSTTDSNDRLLGNYTDDNNYSSFYIRDTPDFQISFVERVSGTYNINAHSRRMARDTGWYHIVWAIDTTQATDTDRVKLYVNGVQETLNAAYSSGTLSTTAPTLPSQNYDTRILAAYDLRVGARSGTDCWDGLMSQFYVIDGQQLGPESFGFTDPLTNTWKPKKYVNTTASHGDAAGVVGFGTNGFYLPFDGSASIGQDQSGQGNNYTPVNFGGTVELDSPLVTGTRPILNVTQGGAQAGVGVFGQNVGYAVTVYNDGGGNKYYIDGVKQATLTGLIRGATYTFDTSDSTVSSHPFRFSATSNGSHGGGSEYTNGVAAITGAATTITIPYNAPNTLYYYCTSHSGMGADITGITTNEKLADQYASNCTLAFAGIGSTTPVDVSASIACTTSTKTLGINGAPSADVSNFYHPSSPHLVGNSSWFTLATTDDVEMGTGDYTIETYVYFHSFPVTYNYIFANAGSNTTGFAAWIVKNDGTVYTTYYNGTTRPELTSAAGSVATGRWYHLAWSRVSGTQHIFVDGVCVARGTWSEDVNSSPDIRWGTNPASTAGEYSDLSLSDFRIYKGVGKYTASAVGEQAFVVPSAVPDILPDSPSGVSGGSKLTKITEGAVDFDGESFVVTSASSDFDFGSGDFTIEAYVRPTNATQTDPSVVSLWNFPDSRRSWGIFGNSGGVAATYNGSIRGAVSPDGEFATRTEIAGFLRLDSWNHVAFVRNGNTLNFFIDGVSQGTASYTGSVYSNTTDGVMVGAMGDASDDRNNINARISNVRVIKGTALYTKNFTPPSAPLTNVTNTKLLTCQENQFKILTDTTDATGGNSIQNTNNSGITSTTGNRSDSNSGSLVLAVPFNGTTDDICDEIGSKTAKAATLTNSPSSENIGHFYGKSYKFTGADGQRINYAASADFNFGTGAFTIEGWYYHLEKTSSNVARRYFVHNETAWESSRWIIYCGYTGNADRATFYTYDTYAANGNAPFLIGKTIFTVGNWYHIAVTRSSNTFRLFVNGRLEDSGSDSNSVGNSTIDIEVGGASQQTDRTLFGHIQDLRIYKGVAKYTAPFVPPRVPTYDSAVTPSSNIVGLAGGESLQTNFNPFITDINTVRGQETGYATLNNLVPGACTLTDGNLTATAPSGTTHGTARSTLTMDTSGTGKFYFEATLTKIGGTYAHIGVLDAVKTSDANYVGNTTNCFSYRHDGKKQSEGTTALSYGDSFTTGDTIGCSLDCGSGELRFYKNGVDQGVAKTITADYHACFAVSNYGSSGKWEVNFGQKPFKFAPPEGFQPLNAANTRPVKVISRPDQYVGVTTYSGDNTDPKQINLGMAPDLIWVKARNQTNWNWLTDTVRGAPNKLYSNENSAEDTAPQYGQADSLNDFGFVAGGGTNSGDPVSDSNKTGTDYVVWSWKAGGNKNTFNVDDVGYASAAAAGLTGGDITPSGASVGTKQGFSIVKFTGPGSAGFQAVPHGLSEKPKFILCKDLDNARNWGVFHEDVITADTKAFILNSDSAVFTSGTACWDVSAIDSTTFTPYFRDDFGASYGADNVAYLWHDVPGLQKFGSYEGNDALDGPFVELGFKPAVILLKNADATQDWAIIDGTRDTFNPSYKWTKPSDSAVENSTSTNNSLDILSNGFKLRGATDTNDMTNGPSQTIIYAAWAESPSIDLFGGGANAR